MNTKIPLHHAGRRAFSMLELIATVSLMGIIMAIALPRLSSHSEELKINACHLHKANIEIQTELWFRCKGKWPRAKLSDIGASARYFPDGLPRCPLDDAVYTINQSSGRIVGHTHRK